MKKLTLIICLFVLQAAHAQLALPEQENFDSSAHFLKYSGMADWHSSSLSNEFVSKFIQGGWVDTDLIKRTDEKQNDINRFGIELNNQILFASFLKKFKSLPYSLALEYNNNTLISTMYNKDLYRFCFEGNNSYLGDTLDFKGNNFSVMSYHSFGLGLMEKVSKSYFTVNFIGLRNYQSHQIQDGYFYSSADTAYIDTRLKGDVYYTTPKSKGIGLQVNFQLNKELPWVKEKKAYFFFQVKNFGVVKVQNLQHYQIDTTIHYNGFQLSPFIYQNDSLEGVHWMDSLSIKHDTITKMVFTPVCIHFGKSINYASTDKFQSFFGIKLYPSVKYVPKVYFGLSAKLGKIIFASLGASYGGFGNIRGTAAIQLSGEKVKFGIGTEDFFGLVSKQGYGKNVSIRLLCAF